MGITYNQWLQQQPAEVQNDILGETNAEALRSGKLKVPRFEQTTPLTLDEYRDKVLLMLK